MSLTTIFTTARAQAALSGQSVEPMALRAILTGLGPLTSHTTTYSIVAAPSILATSTTSRRKISTTTTIRYMTPEVVPMWWPIFVRLQYPSFITTFWSRPRAPAAAIMGHLHYRVATG